MTKRDKLKIETTHIRISVKFHKWLNSKGRRGESFEEIIKRLTKNEQF